MEEGCKQELQQAAQNPKGDSGTAGSGDVTSYGKPGPGNGRHCGEMLVAGSGPSHVENGAIIVEGRPRWITVCSPIVLDLDGDGIEYVTLAAPLLVDPHGTGRAEYTAWVAPDDGMLIYDANGDGIGQHDEFVLTTFVEDTHTDLEALRAFDSNKDGVLNASDSYWAGMKIGRDLNQNGKFEANEVKTLAEHGITAINLVSGVQNVSSPDAPIEGPSGVYTFNTGQFVRANGSVGSFADVAFQSLAYSNTVHSDASVKVTSLGTVYAWTQTSAAGVALNLPYASHGGYYGFVEFYGNAGNDIVLGGPADNVLAGAGGADTLYGEGGDDLIVIDYEDVVAGAFDGGDGYDTLVYTSGEGLYLDASAHAFEMVVGGTGNDTIFASAGTFGTDGVLLVGHEGNDSLSGNAGNDYLVGGAGSDTFSGGDGDDIFLIDGSDGWTSIYGGNNLLQAGDIVIIDSDVGYYFGNLYTQHVENLYGGSGDDVIYAAKTGTGWFYERGSNRLDGGEGNDYIYGGAADDIY